MINKFINKAGVEIEGFYYIMPGFNGYNLAQGGPFDPQLVYDGSLKINGHKANHDCSFPGPINHNSKVIKAYEEWNSPVKPSLSSIFRVGEIVSNPIDNNASVIEFLKRYWPDKTNSTTSLHFHLSFNSDIIYSCLMTEGFGEYFTTSLQNFVVESKLNKVIQSRVFNKCSHSKYYCKNMFVPEKQIYVKKKIWHDQSPYRYTMLNFCYGLHKTMECRVFSSHTNLKSGLLCWKWLVDMINSYLEKNYESFRKDAIFQESISTEIDDNLLKSSQEEHEEEIILA